MITGPVLALDLATATGFASGLISDKLPRFGSVAFGRSDASEAVFGRALRWCRERFPGHGLIAYESAIAPVWRAGRTNVATTAIAFGLKAISEAVAYDLGIQVVEATVADVRTFFIGRGNLPGKEAKAQVWERCRQIGASCTDYDQSDAVALWFYVAALYDPRTSARSTPLFGHVP